MRRTATALAIAAAAVAVLAGCSKNTGSDTAGQPSLPAVPATTQAGPTTEAASAAETNERGRVVKQLGETASIISSKDPGAGNATFAIDKIDADPKCFQYGTKPKGHTLVLHVRAATGSDQHAADVLGWTLTASNFSIVTKDGVTKQADMGMCTDPSDDQLPYQFGPNQKFTGKIELDVPELSGILALTSSFTSGGWEWKF
ncbi:hypothetical protein [Amycolatopsis thermophila]|uniref:Lipoprotein n=1 Tax=Amycolatopsis thermophila TaxID=206084 RepID=A0ABU0EMZ4_9PSEU|nr:hypothetical protein [Amycolatopsis thermophila]MDQ0376607.1 hypothetical protein [Amycolatopsis thermophila]